MRKLFKYLIDKRIIILSVLGVLLYIAISRYQVSLWYVLAAGVFLGVVFGKVFCRWVCPMGLVMELLMSISPDSKIRGMYQYHKIGCPIAWISGFLNRASLFRIRLDADTCKTCGKCDKQCYIVAMEPTKYSLYKAGLDTPGSSYTCSKCLKCVAACPNGSLKYSV